MNVFERWIEGTPHGRTKRLEWQEGNIFYEKNVIFSYDTHFHIAVIDRKAKKVIFNIDRYSRTTSQHQSKCRHYLNNYGFQIIGVSERALIHFFRFDSDLFDKIVDWSDGEAKDVFWDSKTQKYYSYSKAHYDNISLSLDNYKPFTFNNGMFIPQGEKILLTDGEYRQPGYWHLQGGILFADTTNWYKLDDGSEIPWKPSGEDVRPVRTDTKYYLGTVDERQYCVIELPKRVKNLAQAYECLKPKEVRQAEAGGVEVLRQGEWFFVETSLKDKDIKALKGAVHIAELPNTTSTNHHFGKIIQSGKNLFATGMIRHSAGEHKPLRLGKKWYEVYKNTEVRSSTQAGGVD